MIEKSISHDELIKQGCIFAPQAGFAYSSYNSLGTLNIYSCISVCLFQGEVRVLAHLDCEPVKHTCEMLDYLFKKNAIKNEKFQKAYLVLSEKTPKIKLNSLKDYVSVFSEKVESFLEPSPVNFCINDLGNICLIQGVKDKKYSQKEAEEFLAKRLLRKNLICANEDKEI